MTGRRMRSTSSSLARMASTGGSRLAEKPCAMRRDSSLRLRGTAQDITQLKLLQRMKDEWMSVIAHDLRQPIGVIKMSAELLPDLHVGKIGAAGGSDHRTNSRRGECAGAHGRRPARHVAPRSASALARAGVGGSADDRTPDGGASRAPHGRTSRDRFGSRRSRPRCTWIAVRFDQVLGNLISNAVKYGDPHGEIRVHVEQHAGEVEISVTNRGEGNL